MTIQLSPDLLQGPIPGMSLTKEPGAYPWERPTQLTTVDEAVDFYAERLLNEKTEDSFLKAIDNGVSIDQLTEMLTVSGTMNGIHNLDVSILINPYVKELMRFVAESADIKYIDSYKQEQEKNRVPYRFVKKYLEEALEEEQHLIPEEEVIMQDEMPIQKGLMARPSAEQLPQEMPEEELQ